LEKTGKILSVRKSDKTIILGRGSTTAAFQMDGLEEEVIQMRENRQNLAENIEKAISTDISKLNSHNRFKNRNLISTSK
jgi:hypothetical protein